MSRPAQEGGEYPAPVSEREAACNCGQLRVVAKGEPVRVSVCHCLACQRRTGSAFGVQARFSREDAQVSGEHREYVRVSDDGESRSFHFCPVCGATVFYFLSPEPEMIAIPVGAFADPSFPPPRRSIYESRSHSWVSVPTATEHYD
jgi:hypothetical protein